MLTAKSIVLFSGVALVATCSFLAYSFAVSSWKTLDKEAEYLGDSNSTKLGHKYSSLLVSTTATENDLFWKEKIEGLDSSYSFQSSGFFNETNTKHSAFKSASETDKNTKLNEAKEQLKTECKTKYDETNASTSLNSTDKNKWDEFWKLCSLDGNNPMSFSG